MRAVVTVWMLPACFSPRVVCALAVCLYESLKFGYASRVPLCRLPQTMQLRREAEALLAQRKGEQQGKKNGSESRGNERVVMVTIVYFVEASIGNGPKRLVWLNLVRLNCLADALDATFDSLGPEIFIGAFEPRALDGVVSANTSRVVYLQA